jgi:hypothetical protein
VTGGSACAASAGPECPVSGLLPPLVCQAAAAEAAPYPTVVGDCSIGAEQPPAEG